MANANPNDTNNQNNPSGGLLPEYGGAGVPIFGSAGGFTGLVNNLKGYNPAAPTTVPGVSVPNQNPAAASGLASQMQASQDYLKNLSSNSDALYNNAAAQTRTQLNQGIKNVREDFNSRGLLSSGGETGGELGQESAAQSSLASTRNSINSGLLQNAQGMQGNAFNTAATLAQPGPNIASPYLSGVASNIGAQTANTQLANSLYGQAAGGAGSLVGTGLASAIQSQPSSTYSGMQPSNIYTPQQAYSPYTNPYSNLGSQYAQ